MTVTGSAFTSDATLTIGGVPATAVVVQNTTTITGVAASRSAAGPGDVVVTAGGKTALLPQAFQFFAPSGSNIPPVVTGVRSAAPRANQPAGFADTGDEITLTPTVSNAETSGVTLTYAWSGPGTFSPTTDGTTTWHLPTVASPAPLPVTATLVVTESFVEGSVRHRQDSAPFGVMLQLHDSRQEVLDMGEDFLTLFTRQLPGDTVLHNFSRTCDGGRGRADEASDGDANRRDIVEDFNAFKISRRPTFAINFHNICSAGDKPPQLNTDACASYSISWAGFDKTMNAPFVTQGIDYVSAVLENNQWKLCHSTFVGTGTYPTLGLTKAVSW